MKLSDVKAFFKKYVTKQVLVIGLVVLTSASVYTSCNTRAKLSAVRSELSASQTLNTLVTAEKSRLEALIPIYKDSIAKRDVVIAAKEKKINNQLKEINTLQDSLKHTLAEVGNITADSSYKYINNRVVATSERKYPFDSTQVKAIHYTFLERDGLFTINNKLNTTVVDLRQLSSTKDNQIADLNKLKDVYLQGGIICKTENEAYKIQVEGLKKSEKKQKFLKNILLPPAAVGILAVAIKFIAK